MTLTEVIDELTKQLTDALAEVDFLRDSVHNLETMLDEAYRCMEVEGPE